ncbi:MAG: holo-ACP synthase [Deltaproteobacteria bacterium]|nr:holo-ACP synthase [Candidatus Anaeroferrophillacea bacterium]
MIQGIGTDIVDIRRFAGIMARRGEGFLERLFTAGERAYCDGKADPALHYAARFAAREALLKALGTGLAAGVGWHDVEVARDTAGRPRLVLHRRAEEIRRELMITALHLSITHEKEYALAFVIAECRFQETGVGIQP